MLRTLLRPLDRPTRELVGKLGVNCRNPEAIEVWESAAKLVGNDEKVHRLPHGVQTGQ